METPLEQLVESYKVLPSTAKVVQNTQVLLLVGVSGAGKDSIKQGLLKTGNYHHIVSHTTRLPRENDGVLERDGMEYHFITKEEAAKMLHKGAFVEAKMYSGNLYGTSVAELEKARAMNKIALTTLEVQGVAEYEAISEAVISVFVLPPSYADWQKRLVSRYGTRGPDPQDMRHRMEAAVVELEEALKKDYYHFVVNENLSEAVKTVDSIAHHYDEFTQIDRSYRVWAERLLEELRAGVQSRV